ncbi:hypothetical protein [Gloeobacter violaceus]|uniref:Gsr0603 protein n=1 Tax=Gloeobacter violaceus (strain ATCC 29082 / PCC 7421) TaxID=251221 RepID=Q7NN11_GLOVI|nr:hypothetical protein [Gloeobacter violaceus]BAC88544.1 gsr0603 [Gloeobacter violaceus PCC 7421]
MSAKNEVLCRVENWRVQTFELSDADVDRFGQTIRNWEKQVAERQKKNERDRGMKR